jgi:hypothetical protein
MQALGVSADLSAHANEFTPSSGALVSCVFLGCEANDQVLTTMNGMHGRKWTGRFQAAIVCIPWKGSMAQHSKHWLRQTSQQLNKLRVYYL